MRPAKPVTPPAPEPAANRHGWSRIPEAEAPEKEAEAPEKEDEAEWKILF
jgi:hypothetical protein